MRRFFPLAASFLLAACATTNPGVPDTQEDIPVPLKFSRATDNEETKSYYEKHEKFRNYRVSYRGEEKSLQALAEYYQREMPHNGWTLENATPEADGIVTRMTFLKDQERATVTTRHASDNEHAYVTVEIRLK